MGGNTFCSAALSVFSLLHAAYLWHTIVHFFKIWRWCAELCTSPSTFVPLVTPISHMVHPFSLLYFNWISSSLLIRSVE